jgi:DNA-binding LacI/PurR family transcriptional regulator
MTLGNVAERAGVALNTARKALHGAASVRPYIRERVLLAAKELDYHPNLLARALKENALRVVPISVIHLDEIYFGSLAGHLSRYLIKTGMEPALCFNPAHLLRMSRSLSTSASILASGFDVAVIRALAQRQKVATVDANLKPTANVGCVEVDFPAVYRETVATLLATGRRRIAICSPHYLRAAAHGWPDPKFETVLNVLREAGVNPVAPSGKPVFATPDEFGAWLDERPGRTVDALFCQNDMAAVRMVGVLAALGRRTPDDLLVIGCDNNLVVPGMWSIAVDTAAMAWDAVDLLQILLNGATHVAPRLHKPRLVDDRGMPVEIRPARTQRPSPGRKAHT